MQKPVSLTVYSDVLCIWAYIAEARLDEVQRQFGAEVAIAHRFCSVFGDTAHRVGAGWADKGGYAGFAAHVRESARPFDHVRVHAGLWERVRPASSTPAHLLLKAVQRIDSGKCEPLLHALRRAFFERCEDIARWPLLLEVAADAGVPGESVQTIVDSGIAHADLEADHRERTELMVQGSPTYILDNGRQKLFGNVGYTVIEANIRELLREPAAGAASWC